MKFLTLVVLSLWFGLAPVMAMTTIERKVALGGQLTGGNTEVQSLHAELRLNRNRQWLDETTVKATFDHEFSSGVETQFKGYGSLRFARSIGHNYYHYYKLETEHDRFQDINLRLIPTIGLGYWFADDDVFRSRLEAALGYQREYLISQANGDEVFVLTVSSDILLGPFANEIDVYAAIDDLDNYRFTNVAKWQIKLNAHYSFKLSLKDEYNNRPATGIKNNDVSLRTSLEYAFKEVKQ